MSALSDRTFPIRFHFGNALKDLAHQLPDDDFVQRAPPSTASVEKQLDQCLENLAQLQLHAAELHLLIEDIGLFSKK